MARLDPAPRPRLRRTWPWLAAAGLACVPTWPEHSSGGADDAEGGLPPLPPPPPEPTPGPGTGGGDPDGDDGVDPTAGDDGADDGGDSSESGDTPATDVGSAADPTTSQLRIWRVLADPAGKDGGPESPEFVVLHNPGPGPAVLTGARLEASSWTGLAFDELDLDFTSLDKDQSLVIYRFSSPSDPPTTAVPSVAITTSSGLRNADGQVALLDGAGGLVDLLVYGGPSDDPLADAWNGPPAADPGSDEALCRTQPNSLSATAWGVCPPTPLDVAPVELGPLRIVEVVAGGPGDESDENTNEFIEITNPSSSQVSLVGWQLEVDGGLEPIEVIAGPGGCTPEPCLPPGGRLLVVHDDYLGPSGTAGLAVTADGRLGLAGLDPVSVLRLRRPDGQSASTHRDWPDPGVAPIADPKHEGLQRSSPQALDTPAAWSATTPTPGQ